MTPLDFCGKEIKIGSYIVYALECYHVCFLKYGKVTQIKEDGRMYVDSVYFDKINSPQRGDRFGIIKDSKKCIVYNFDDFPQNVKDLFNQI
jgi:hypothetical protein